ncbi:MAG: hypothetical protein ABIF08_02705 [Nanoarchaeota archaeon]
MQDFVKKNKAQSSIEFLLIFAFLIAILLSVSFIVFHKSNSVLDAQNDFEADGLLKEVANKINTVFIEESGFSMNITIPETISGEDYNFSIVGGANLLRLSIFEKTYDMLLVTEDVVDINKLNNKNGKYLLKNIDSIVYIIDI